MSGGGKSSTSTSSVSIPPEVLARYNAVNTRAENVAEQGFTPYGGQFVAPLTQTQQAGISNINQGSGAAQPYYQGAGAALLGGAAQAQPYYQAATQGLYGAQAAAAPLQTAAAQNISGAQGGASPYLGAAQQSLAGGAAQSQALSGAALQSLYGGQAAAAPLQSAAAEDITQAQAGAQPYLGAAQQSLAAGAGQSQGLSSAALQSLYAGQAAASPFQAAAAQNISGAQAAAQPYQGMATGFGLAGARQIAPGGLNVGAYMSPYTESVAQPTYQALRQQQQQEQQKIVGDQVRSGAFGGDRGKIAQAVLAQQQNLATGQAMGNIYQQGYGQALGAAQQQQGVALQAEQANRQAQQQAAQQFLGIGQQGFGQGITAAQQQASLAQQLMGQGSAAAQQQAALAQQLYGQGATSAQQQAALGQQVYGMGTGAAQQRAALAQQLLGQGSTAAQQQAALGQQLYGQGATSAQQQAALGQQVYGMGSSTGQQQAALANQLFGQGAQSAQTQQALGQGLYGIGAGVSQGLAGLGTGAQQAALQGGQAQLAAGTVEQQTQQANNQALYNQFLQQQGYPFQVAQFLANIAMGTGALSGSTTTTQQPQSFFSDERLKENVEPIGKTFDGQKIVRFKYKGEPGTRIGLVAQDVEKKHPEAVGLAGGYKTVDYDAATDEAAARAPKAYGGGLSPWDGNSMGGSVFREDAGAGFAAGGAPGGDDVLAQINALVNSHQGMFPYGKAGLYGGGMGKAGPYGSTLMQPGSRGLMLAPPVRQEPPYDARQAMRDISDVAGMPERIQKGYSGIKAGLVGSPEQSRTVTSPSGQTSTEVTQQASSGLFGRAGEGNLRESAPARAYREVESYLDGSSAPSGNARGGAIRSGLAMGGLPYSQAEDEHVPEDVSKPMEAPKLQTASTGPMKDQGAEDAKMAMQMAQMAAMFAASDRRLKDNIEPIGKLFDGQKVYRYNLKGDDKTQIGLMAQEVEKRHPDAVGLAPRKGYANGGDPVQDEMINGYSRRAIEDMFNQGIIPIESRGQQFNAQGEPLRSRAGATGISQVMPSTGPEAARLAGLEWDQQRFERDPEYNRDLGLAYFTQQVRQQGDPLRAAAAYNAGPGRVQGALAGGEDYFGRLPAETQDYLRRFASSNPGGLIPPALIEQVIGRQPTAAGTSAPSASGASGSGGAERSRQTTPEGKDWFGRNESWIMPLVTGLGTMASSPSRYLGSAVLQGLMGAGQAAQQNIGLEGQRLKTAEETKKIGEEAELTRQRQRLTGASTQQVLSGIAAGAEDPTRRTVRIFRNGRYTLIPREEFYNNPSEYQLYVAPYSAEERGRLQAPPSREPAPPSATPTAPTGGEQPALDGSRPDVAVVPPPTVPTTRSTDPVALVTSLPEETRNLADQEIRVARGQSTTDLRAAAERIPSAQDVFTTARTRASAAAGSLPDRLNLAKEFMALPDDGIGSLGRANVFLTPMLSWANSTLRLFNVQDRDGNLVQLNPRQLAGLEAIDKETIQSALNRQGQSGSRAFAELNAILSATPNTQMTRETVQKILSSNFMEEQRAIDLDNFTNLWRNYALRGREGAVGVSPDELRLTGPQVEREFNRLYPPAQYTREKTGIEKILDSRVGGRPLIDLIIESRGAPSQPMIEYMNNNFANEGGARLLRHFYGR